MSRISAEVILQSLLDHTCIEILKEQGDVVNSLGPQESTNFRSLFKWGCDGSSEHNEYKQKFIKGESSDASVFLTSLVPLQIL